MMKEDKMGTLAQRDLELRATKKEKSAKYFENTKVVSCGQIVRKNGQAVAVGFPQKKTGYKAPNSYVNTQRSTETVSFAQHTHKIRPDQHAGMAKKPLVAYDPNSYRSRLPIPTVVMGHKNASTIQIGNPEASMSSHFKTHNEVHFKAPDLADANSHPGIKAEQTRWVHKHQDQLKNTHIYHKICIS